MVISFPHSPAGFSFFVNRHVHSFYTRQYHHYHRRFYPLLSPDATPHAVAVATVLDNHALPL